MTDEQLLKELRRHNYAVPFGGQSEYAVKAADRIEQLQAQNLRLSGMVYDLTAKLDEANKKLSNPDYEWHPHELGGFTWKSKTSRN